MNRDINSVEMIDIAEQRIADMSVDLLKVLLWDKSTGKYIVWATDNYCQLGEAYDVDKEIFPELITGKNTNIIQPRVSKSAEEQIKRTRDKAEVFTPSWICNIQNNQVDDVWFGKTGLFNRVEDESWTVNPNKIIFPNGKTWQDYVQARRLEISCGEAPYLVSRYDTVSGNQIPLKSRIGLLDRKLRIVNENTVSSEEWHEWTRKAFESVYGYEYQGDNVLLARENLLLTYIDYYKDRFGKSPTLREIKKIANVVSWNIWQMDGITYTAPFSRITQRVEQKTIFEMLGEVEEIQMEAVCCKINDWRGKRTVEFRAMIHRGN